MTVIWRSREKRDLNLRDNMAAKKKIMNEDFGKHSRGKMQVKLQANVRKECTMAPNPSTHFPFLLKGKNYLDAYALLTTLPQSASLYK